MNRLIKFCFLVLCLTPHTKSNAHLCSELLKPIASENIEVIRSQDYIYFRHYTPIENLKGIISDKSLLSKTVNPNVSRYWAVSPEHMVFIELIHKNTETNFNDPTRYYSANANRWSPDGKAYIHLPLKLIDSPNLLHFSAGHIYGKFENGNSFHRSALKQGLQRLMTSNKNEFVFNEKIPFELDEIKIEVNPKRRAEVLSELIKIDPDFPWHQILISAKDHWPHVDQIPFENWIQLQWPIIALADLVLVNPAKAQEYALRLFDLMDNQIFHQNNIKQLDVLQFLAMHFREDAIKILGRMMGEKKEDTILSMLVDSLLTGNLMTDATQLENRNKLKVYVESLSQESRERLHQIFPFLP